MREKLVSIIIPNYNKEKYLEKCLTSLFQQTYLNLEIIVVDDGSTDDSLKILKKYRKIHDNLYIYELAHKGVSAARNYGIDKSKGDIIGFVDSDDYIETNMISSMYNQMITNKLDVVGCDVFYTYSNNAEKTLSIYNNQIIIYNDKSYIIDLFNYGSMYGYCFNKLYKKSILAKLKQKNKCIFNENITLCEDLLFNWKLFNCFQNIRVGYIRYPYYHYLQSSNSISNTGNYTFIDVYNLILRETKNNSHLYNLALINYIKLCLQYRNNCYAKENTNKYNKIINKYIKKAHKIKNIKVKDKLWIFGMYRLPHICIFIRQIMNRRRFKTQN